MRSVKTLGRQQKTRNYCLKPTQKVLLLFKMFIFDFDILQYIIKYRREREIEICKRKSIFSTENCDHLKKMLNYKMLHTNSAGGRGGFLKNLWG
jgi:hypothetical protein